VIETSQMMEKSKRRSRAEPHQQEHLANLALAGRALGGKGFVQGRALRAWNTLFYVKKSRADVCQQSDKEHVQVLLWSLPKVILS
jgi:hypothetical protein